MPTQTAEKTSTLQKEDTSTVKLHRILKAPPERVYKAILDPAAISKWLPPYGFTCTVHQLEAKVGGSFKMSFTNFSTGKSHSFGGKYTELKPYERIVMTDKFDNPKMQGEIRTSYMFRKIAFGTELSIVQENIPAAIPRDACYLGWQESLEFLTKLVEPEIPQDFQ